jgi:hypothetical protein
VCDVAQESYPKPELQLWGLPVGLSFIVGAIAATFWVNQGVADMTNTIVGILALPALGFGIVSLGAFIYSLIRRSVYHHEITYIHTTH